MLCLKADMLKLMATIFKKDVPQAEFFKKALKFEMDETSFVDTVNEQFEYEILCRYVGNLENNSSTSIVQVQSDQEEEDGGGGWRQDCSFSTELQQHSSMLLIKMHSRYNRLSGRDTMAHLYLQNSASLDNQIPKCTQVVSIIEQSKRSENNLGPEAYSELSDQDTNRFVQCRTKLLPCHPLLIWNEVKMFSRGRTAEFNENSREYENGHTYDNLDLVSPGESKKIILDLVSRNCTFSRK